MSKTTPVRWWRNDSDRYLTRGPQQVPAATISSHAWALELIAKQESSLTEIIKRQQELLARACFIPLKWDELSAPPDPIRDIMTALEFKWVAK